MTTLYRPVLIETADLPMNKFPEGTIATHPDYWPVERCSCSRWESNGPDRYDPDMVGWSALVPIEAEEEWAAFTGTTGTMLAAHFLHGIPSPGRGSVANLPRKRRYVTPWEESR